MGWRRVRISWQWSHDGEAEVLVQREASGGQSHFRGLFGAADWKVTSLKSLHYRRKLSKATMWIKFDVPSLAMQIRLALWSGKPLGSRHVFYLLRWSLICFTLNGRLYPLVRLAQDPRRCSLRNPPDTDCENWLDIFCIAHMDWQRQASSGQQFHPFSGEQIIRMHAWIGLIDILPHPSISNQRQ